MKTPRYFNIDHNGQNISQQDKNRQILHGLISGKHDTTIEKQQIGVKANIRTNANKLL